jgi:16S rRNA (cytosine967-C5)-methyltransferase
VETRSGSQLRTFAHLFAGLKPYLRTDQNLPARIQKMLAGEKRFGSRDRRLYRELLYTTVRFLPWFESLPEERGLRAMAWLAADIPATTALRADVANEWGEVPVSVAEKASKLNVHASLVPAWLKSECSEAVQSPNDDVLQTRAPLWLRLQTSQPDAVWREFEQLGWSWRVSNVLPNAVEMLGEVDVTKTRAFAEGKIEVQDLGSQLVLAVVGLSRGEHWLDACAGAGGKSLFLADAIGPTGRVVAHDIRMSALHALRERALRAGFRNIDLASQPTGTFDAVLVDAPCTGTGTWRRSPHLKWCTGPAEIAAAAQTQLELLKKFSGFVRAGGRLVYATCSLCRSENESVIAAFLCENPDFSIAALKNDFNLLPRTPAGLAILPATHDTDGFYVAELRRK